MATPEQVEKIKRLTETIKVGDDVIEKWFTKAGVDEWGEMNAETIQKCIETLEKKLTELNKKGGK